MPPSEDGTAPEWICGEHWKRVPKTWRQRLSLYRRRYNAAERKGDEEGMRVAARVWWSRWERCKALFAEDQHKDGDMPALMQEDLRRVGLL